MQKRFICRGYRTFDNDLDSLEDVKDVAVAVVTANAEQRRYIFRNPNYRKGRRLFNRDLNTEDNGYDDDNEEDSNAEYEQLPWLTDGFFVFFCVIIGVFVKIVMIKIC